MTMLILAVALTSWICVPAQGQVLEHDRYIKYIPEGAYTLLSFRHQEAIKKTAIYREHTEFLAGKVSNHALPFPDTDVLRSYKIIIYNVRRFQKETAKAERTDEYYINPPSVEESAWIYEISGLRLHIEEALGAKAVSDTSVKVGKLPICSFSRDGQTQREHLYLCESEPDVLLVCGEIELLKSMVLSGLGLQKSLDYTDEYYSVLDLVGDHIDWSVQLVSTISQSNIDAQERRGATNAQLAYMRESASRKYQMIVRYTIFEDERLIYRTEYIFTDEDAAEEYYPRMSMRIAPPAVYTKIAAEDEIEEPQEVKTFFAGTITSSKTTLEGNKVVRNRIIDRDYINEYLRIHRQYKDYFEAQSRNR